MRIPADTPLEVACVIGCAVQTGVGAVLDTARVEAGARAREQTAGRGVDYAFEAAGRAPC